MSDEKKDSIDSTIYYAHNPPIPLSPAQRAKKQKLFLKAYREIGIIKAACEVAKINRSTFKYWRDHDEAFAAQLPDTEEEANEAVEMMAYEQAAGVEEPALSMGQIVYEYEPLFDEDGKPKLDKQGKPIMVRGKMVKVKKYSPSVLITLLKARMPEKYKEQKHIDHSGSIDIEGAKERLLQKLGALPDDDDADAR